MQKYEEPSLAKTILKEEKVCELTLPAFKTCYIPTVIKTKCYWHKDRHIGQWSRIESTPIDVHVYTKLIFAKVQW